MDLILSLSIEKIGEASKEAALEPAEMDWLQNANTDLMKFFNATETMDKVEAINEIQAIKVDHLDIGFEEGQYYVLDHDTQHPLNDNDKVHLPGYIVTVHIRNHAQTDLLQVDPRYSEQLLDFDHLLIGSDPLSANPLSPSARFEGDPNRFDDYFDLPHMIVEGGASPQRILLHDRAAFHPSLAIAPKPVEHGNILETLGISGSSDDFFKQDELEEVYEETHRHAPYLLAPQRPATRIDPSVKPNFRQRLTYLKKALTGI